MSDSSTMPIPTPLPRPLPPGSALGQLQARAQRMNFARVDPLECAGLVPHAPQAEGIPGERLAQFLGLPAQMTFASGAVAMRQTLSALIMPGDAVIMDGGADPAMFETVLQARARLHRCPPGSVDAVERRLSRLVRQHTKGRIFVIVPAVARLTSASADLAELCALCASYGATLIVDVSQDLGVMGQAGLGVAEIQGCLGQIDVVLFDLAANFGIPGGFAAFRDPALAAQLNAGSLDHWHGAEMILSALDLIDSAEGCHRRRVLHANALRLRNHLLADGLPVMGDPSPVVPVRLPPRQAEALTALLRSAGPHVPLLQAPEVAGRAPRWMIRLTAGHGPADIDDLADLVRDVIRSGDRAARRVTLSEALP